MIEVYGKDDCYWCGRAKAFLEDKKLPFEYFRIGEHLNRDEFLEKFPGAKTVPQIIVDGKSIGGYDNLVNLLASD
jgi:glutaredoxin